MSLYFNDIARLSALRTEKNLSRYERFRGFRLGFLWKGNLQSSLPKYETASCNTFPPARWGESTGTRTQALALKELLRQLLLKMIE